MFIANIVAFALGAVVALAVVKRDALKRLVKKLFGKK